MMDYDVSVKLTRSTTKNGWNY